MNDSVPNLRGGHFETLKFVVGIVLAGAGFFGGAIWKAAQYPDRTEFNQLRDMVWEVKQAGAVMKAQMDGQSNVIQSMDGKLNRIMLDNKPRK